MAGSEFTRTGKVELLRFFQGDHIEEKVKIVSSPVPKAVLIDSMTENLIRMHPRPCLRCSTVIEQEFTVREEEKKE